MRSLLKLAVPALALGLCLVLFAQAQAPAGLYV
jgi:hypothetical protein